MENNLNNLPPFYVGQKVVCVSSIGPYKKDNIYTIMIFQACKICGQKRVGCLKSGKTNCIGGSCVHTEVTGYALVYPTRFAPLKEQSFPLIELSKVIEKEKQLVSSN